MRRARGMKLAALAMAGSLALAACASDEETSNGGSGSSGGGDASGELMIGLAYDTGGRGDKSFNDSAYAGVEAAVAEFGGEIQEVSPNDDGSDRPELLSQLAEAGYDPVIAVGFAYGEFIADAAADYPDTTFAIVDSSVAELGADNVTGLLFAANEGSFLGGVAAALKSTTGTIGFVGGVDIPLINEFEAGYVAGARAVDPEIVIEREYISPAGDFTGFSDPARGQIVAQGMFDAGADVVYHAAGGSGQGVFQAAAASGGLAIGVDSDQYETIGDAALQAVIVTSVLKRVDNAVEAFIGTYVDGSVEGGTDIVNDLSTEGVGLSTSGGFIDDISAEVEDYTAQIVDGTITVPTTPED